MRRLTGLVTTAALVAAVTVVGAAAPAGASPGPPVACDPLTNVCAVQVGAPGAPGSHGHGPARPGRGGGAAPQCHLDGPPLQSVPCSVNGQAWSNQHQCYLFPLTPQPPLSDPVWQGHTTGAIYWCRTLPTGLTRGWLPAGAVRAAPPPSPAQLALQALATVRLPAPVVGRSPSAANSDRGIPLTWVNLWTWFWVDRTSWSPRSARAAVGGNWAQVTVTPSRLVVSPGDGGPAASCPGPGRPWQPADGNGAPSAGGCGYRFQRVTAAPIRTTVSVQWSVSWVGSGDTRGVLPAMQTNASSTFIVEQIQVVTR